MKKPEGAPFLPRPVIVLGLVSFLNDSASEMITPVLPLFVTSLPGAGPAVVGLMEGLADGTASILKLISGRLADRGHSRKRLVMAGYGVANAARPLIGLAGSWGTVMLLRFVDRVGKGIRTAPRDSLVSSAVTSDIRGRAFGFHRAMDHAGATLGPLIAFALMSAGVSMRSVFLVSLVPGLLLMLLLAWGISSTRRPASELPIILPPLKWSGLEARLRALLSAAALLAFATAPDVFLVLWASGRGVPAATIPLIWAAAHLVRALVAGAGGQISDWQGRIPIVMAGWVARVALLCALAMAPPGAWLTWTLFLSYAATTAFTEGAERALIGDAAPRGQSGTAFGLYNMLCGLLALPGALLFGALWQWSGMASAFSTAAALTAVSAAALFMLSRRNPAPRTG